MNTGKQEHLKTGTEKQEQEDRAAAGDIKRMGDKNRAEAGSTVRKGKQQDIEAAGNIKRRE